MLPRFFAHASCAMLPFVSTNARAADASTDAPTETAPADEATILVIGQRDRPIEIAPRGLAVSLGDEQFAAVNAFNVEDLMKYAPNFFVRKRYVGDSNGVPGFRGTHSAQSARTLVMVDGFVVANFLGNSFGFSPKWGAVGPGEVRQFDIVYGPYSSRYTGNSMGGIINITTKEPEGTEAFATVQGFVQPYRQYATSAEYAGYWGEAGFGWKQKDGPLSVRVSTRLLQNRGQPMSWYYLTPATGVGTAVTGTVIDPDSLTLAATASGPATTTTRPSGSRTLRNRALARSEGVFFPRIPRWRLNANARYAITDRLQGSVGARFASRPNTDLEGSQRGDTFSYTSELLALDARLNWQATANLRVSAGVDNITNDRAWVFHPYPQRTFLIEAGWKL